MYLHIPIFMCVVDVFMSFVWPASVPQALFFRQNKCVPVFFDTSILKNTGIVRISVFMIFQTCLKRCVLKNHEFWRYQDLQISHHEPIGEENDGWSEPP